MQNPSRRRKSGPETLHVAYLQRLETEIDYRLPSTARRKYSLTRNDTLLCASVYRFSYIKRGASGFVRGFFIEREAIPCTSRRSGRYDEVWDEVWDDEVWDEA